MKSFLVYTSANYNGTMTIDAVNKEDAIDKANERLRQYKFPEGFEPNFELESVSADFAEELKK